ncbi:MAG: hypothetical protein WAT66_00705 [Actinomycetota bacterium]
MKPRSAALAALLCFGVPGASIAAGPASIATALQRHAASQQRGVDMLINVDYQRRFAPLLIDYLADADPRVETDPYLLDYPASGRANVQTIEYPNRYGATIRGHIWIPNTPFTDPVTNATGNGPFPAVIFVNGAGTRETPYWSTAQTLVENGYAVMTWDPQALGLSEANPEAQYCDPDGAWHDPQELGVREQGPCAGQPGEPPPLTFAEAPVETALAPVLAAGGGIGGGAAFYADNQIVGVDWETASASYDSARAPFVFGAFDAVAWLLSSANPQRTLIDATRIGIVGHSLGADAALNVGNGDPLHRFGAVVTYDSAARMLPAVTPSVPTMVQASDHEVEIGPYLSAPDRSDVPVVWQTESLAASGVDHMSLVLAATGHGNWAYNPDPLIHPYAAPMATSSRYGERAGLYFALAWFDRYLKGADTPFVRGDEAAQQADAVQRLLAPAFDESVDRTAIEVGMLDPATGGNAPYLIQGRSIRAELSDYFTSSYAFDGRACADVKTGCGSP